MNSVILIGRLVAEPETRYTQSQMAITRFKVAVDRQVKDKDNKQPTADFIDIIAFDKTAEIIEKFFTKGKRIALQGRIQNNNYENKNGDMVYTYRVVADRIEFVENKEKGSKEQRSQQRSDDYNMQVPEGFEAIEDDDMPF